MEEEAEMTKKTKVVKITGVIESEGKESITPKDRIPISQRPVSCVFLHVAVPHAAWVCATTDHRLRECHDPPFCV
jgi:hypothetical protein